MLGTWRLDTKNEGSVFMRQAIDPVTARPVVQQACNSCRAKKLRCTGEKTGCSRCKTLVRECVYAQPAGKGSGRHKRTKVEGKERKTVHAAAKRASRSPPATTKPETPPLPVAVTAADTGVEKPQATPARNNSHGGAPPDAMSNLGFTMELELNSSRMTPSHAHAAGPFDMSGGPSSPCSIEQWLVGSPPPPMDMASTDMDMYLHWPSSLVDPAAFSTMPSCLSPTINTMPNPLLSPLSTPTTTNGNNNNLHSSSPNILPSLTDDTSTAHSTNSSGNTPPTSHEPPTANSLSTPAMGGYPPPPPPHNNNNNNNNNNTFHELEHTLSFSPTDHGCCQCLQQVVFLIDELEALQTTTTPNMNTPSPPRHGTQLDAGLASHKEALRYGEAMLLCAHCTARPESMTILTFLTDRLAGLCERIVEGYLDLLLPPASHHQPHENKYQVHHQQGTRSLNHHHRHATTDTGMLHSQGQGVRWGVYFGDYEVDSPGEWELLVRNLIVLQLRALAGLLGRVKEVAGMMRVPHCDMLWRKAAGTDKRVGALLGRLDAAGGGGSGGGGGDT
ncbi:hypothetical protein B0T22DRAFT_540488 [Podospora appendiculata]|uniref:Zn(2)-C6 fungal-type domain-containing protein n=1 Tax=Podospora appendiculata TaxID=314037 RepID=A0AAE0WYU8_9PEZI|nr:hypothetical protein B0T22DRAFT_540488 [Podospora appendiculata]